MIKNKFDIALVGICKHFNYGSVLTNFAMFKTIKDMGYSAVIITQPISSQQKPYHNIFSNLPYTQEEVITCKNKREMRSLNEISPIFCVTSDQLFNQNSYNWFDKFMLLDWVWDYKVKCTYAASFGHADLLEHTTDWTRAEMSYFMKKFDIFTVREKSGVQLAESKFGISAKWVLDPIFLCNPQHFVDLAKNFKNEQNIFAYILDANIPELLSDLSHSLKTPVKLVNDYEKDLRAKRKLTPVEEWLSLLINSKFVITDSFHGLCFAIIFKKPFIVVANHLRGITRFESILSLIGMEKRMIKNSDEYLSNKKYLLSPIDWDLVYQRLKPMQNQSQSELEKILSKGNILKPLSDYDLMIKNSLKAGLNKKYLFKMIIYKILSLVLYGKKRNHYKIKYIDLKNITPPPSTRILIRKNSKKILFKVKSVSNLKGEQ